MLVYVGVSVCKMDWKLWDMNEGLSLTLSLIFSLIQHVSTYAGIYYDENNNEERYIYICI